MTREKLEREYFSLYTELYGRRPLKAEFQFCSYEDLLAAVELLEYRLDKLQHEFN